MNRYGYIFDLDGLLVDTQLPFHASAEAEALRERGVKVQPEEISARFAGIPTKRVFATLAPGIDPKELEDRKWEIMLDLLKIRDLNAMPGMFRACQELQRNGAPMAIASASPEAWIRRCLRIDISRCKDQGTTFGQIFGQNFVSAESCAHGKPSPDVFLAAQKLLTDQHEMASNSIWFAIGDGESDVLAGLAAGMDILYVSPSNAKFDGNPKVTRFHTTEDLGKFMISDMD